jgi:hypothetical protein
MTIDFRVSIDAAAPTAFPPPAWCADIPVDLKFPEHFSLPENMAIEVEAVSIEGKFDNLVVWQRAWQATPPQTMSKLGTRLSLRVPLTREIVQAVERKRAGSGPVRLALEFVIRYRQIISSTPAYDSPHSVLKSQTANHTARWEIHRDPWRECLKTLGWNEIEIFELPTGPQWADPQLKEALDLLKSAENLLHFGGDPKAVLAKCYGALEAVAKYAVQDDDKKKGFELLLARAFRGETDKIKEVDALVRALNGFAHFGRHEGYPTRHISWSEARFGLVTTLAVFDLLTNAGRG